jgi:hypothetical protein
MKRTLHQDAAVLQQVAQDREQAVHVGRLWRGAETRASASSATVERQTRQRGRRLVVQPCLAERGLRGAGGDQRIAPQAPVGVRFQHQDVRVDPKIAAAAVLDPRVLCQKNATPPALHGKAGQAATLGRGVAEALVRGRPLHDLALFVGSDPRAGRDDAIPATPRRADRGEDGLFGQDCAGRRRRAAYN